MAARWADGGKRNMDTATLQMPEIGGFLGFVVLFRVLRIGAVRYGVLRGSPGLGDLKDGAMAVCAAVMAEPDTLATQTPSQPPASVPVVTQVWGYVGELIFNMFVLVGMVKMADRIVRETLY